MLLTTTSPDHTIALGKALASALAPGDLIFLEGQLGAGKTRLVKGIAQGLGLDPESISSPTFVIAHEHPCPAGSILVHIDAYRVQSLEDLESIGWTRDSARPQSEFRKGAITVIEWASRMKVPANTPRLQIDITHTSDHTRQISITPVHFPAERIAALTSALAKISQ
jgi:tRNA threonylcarbamoyladenosine biosynthesis protein TsaE